MMTMVTLITALPSPCKARLATRGEFAVKRSDGADDVYAGDDGYYYDDDDGDGDDGDYNGDDDDDDNGDDSDDDDDGKTMVV